MSDVLRDGLLLLLDQDQEQTPVFVYDRKEVQSAMMSDTKEESVAILSDRKDAATGNMSGAQMDTPAPQAVTPRHARSAEVSDRKRDKVAITSDTKRGHTPYGV